MKIVRNTKLVKDDTCIRYRNVLQYTQLEQKKWHNMNNTNV